SADQRTGNAEQDRDDETARVTAGHEQLGDDAYDQPEDNPSQHTHHIATSAASARASGATSAVCQRGRTSRYFRAPPVLNRTTDSVGLIDPLATSLSTATSAAPPSGAALMPS